MPAKNYKCLKSPVLGLILTAFALLAYPSITAWTQYLGHTSEKELHIPDDVWRVPDNNDYNDNSSAYSFERMMESDNFGIFWHKEFGNNPEAGPDSTKLFDLDEVVMELERFYEYYVNELKFVDKGNSVTDHYKALLYIIGGDGGTAFGGGSDSVGIMWTPPSRMSRAPYGALAHELGHSFQHLVRENGSWGFSSRPGSGSIGEMTSQYMLWHVYPKWMTFENYHLESYLEKTHYAFLHETNQYHSPYVLEYWATLHGKEIVGKVWRQAEEGEDPVLAYKRITGIDQETFNKEMFDAARRFMTWDMERIEEVASPYANMHTSEFDSVDDGWFQVAESRCPQNYGYNGVQLDVPEAGTEIILNFKGIAGAQGFRSIKTDLAGWRYGFVAAKEDGRRVYGNTHSNPNGSASFTVPKNTEYLWLVVMGAPSEHWIHIPDRADKNDEQWPYQIKLTGTSLQDSLLE